MSLELHVGDHFHPANYDIDLEVVSVTDHATDGVNTAAWAVLDATNTALLALGTMAAQHGGMLPTVVGVAAIGLAGSLWSASIPHRWALPGGAR